MSNAYPCRVIVNCDEYSERLENYFIEATEKNKEEALIVVGYQSASVVVEIIRKSEEMKNV